MQQRYDPNDLVDFAAAALQAAGLDPAHCHIMAESVVEADLFGHHSHGLVLLPRHIEDLKAGRMRAHGAAEIIRNSGSSILIDGHMLPGPVTMSKAIEAGRERAASHGSAMVVVRQSHHVLSLAVYLERVSRQGQFILIASSNPWAAFVAPFGGRDAVYSPNPIACGIPTSGDPILVDISLSSVAINTCLQYQRRGERLPGRYLLDASGRPSDDPEELFRAPRGTLLPLGGTDLGYKGFALALMVEALTSGLAGFGRADAPAQSSNSAVILLVEPAAFGGGATFLREMDWLVAACHGSAPAGEEPVRLPGERALARKRDALSKGCALDDHLMGQLVDLAAGLGIAGPPPALAGRA